MATTMMLESQHKHQRQGQSVMSWSQHGNHGHELQDGNISTSINGKIGERQHEKNSTSINVNTRKSAHTQKKMEIITIATRQQNHDEHQWQINDGRMKPARASTASDNTRKIARVSMSTQGNQRTHRKNGNHYNSYKTAKSRRASMAN